MRSILSSLWGNVYCLGGVYLLANVKQDFEVILVLKDGIPEFRFKFAKRICKGTEKNQ